MRTSQETTVPLTPETDPVTNSLTPNAIPLPVGPSRYNLTSAVCSTPSLNAPAALTVEY